MSPETGPYVKRKLGVISIPSFYNGVTRDVEKIIAEAQQQDVEGIVIDLRSNGGGALPEAISLTGLFIDKGPVVQKIGRASCRDRGGSGVVGVGYACAWPA